MLYTGLSPAGALAEIGYRLALEPVWPTRIEHELHRIEAKLSKFLRFADVGSLIHLGVNSDRYRSFDYAATQAIAAAAFFLGFDGLIVPSARCAEHNLVIFIEKLGSGEWLELVGSEPVDWMAWRLRRRSQAGG